MRDELLALFRNTERSLRQASEGRARSGTTEQTETSVQTETSAQTADTQPEPAPPSRFLRRFLRPTFASAEPAPSGIASLDSHLGGGFGPGPHLVLGMPGAGKTAFLESVAWEAVSSRRPVLYYALEDGGLRVWERLISTVGCILGGPSVSLRTIRTRTLTPHETETVIRLDQALQTHVFPYLLIVDTLPATALTVSAFIEDLRHRSQEAIEQHGRVPLLLLDSVERLLSLTASEPLPLLMSRLDGTLAADSMPGLLTSDTGTKSLVGAGRLPVKTVMVLESVPGYDDELGRVDLELLANTQTVWTGTLRLLLDQRTGLFSET